VVKNLRIWETPGERGQDFERVCRPQQAAVYSMMMPMDRVLPCFSTRQCMDSLNLGPASVSHQDNVQVHVSHKDISPFLFSTLFGVPDNRKENAE
jgi:hypothetical protein